MADVLRRGLSEEGYAVDVADTGEEGAWLAAENEYDAIVLDLVLPDVDGFTVCRDIRAHQRWSPILMLTARDAVEDRVRGLDAGADDYMVKPFAFYELLARVRHWCAAEPRRARARSAWTTWSWTPPGGGSPEADTRSSSLPKSSRCSST